MSLVTMQPEVTRVLLLEDSLPDARVITTLLGDARRGTFQIDHTGTLKDAADRAATRAYDVALLDLNVPDSHGLVTCETIRAVAPGLPIIVQSGRDEESLAIEAVRKGAQDYLVKSEIEGATLVRAIRYAMERKRVEQALRESEERYALAMRGANDGLWDWNLNTGLIYFSDRFVTMLGCSQEDLAGRPQSWFDRIHRDDSAAFGQAIKAHLDDHTPHLQFEFRIRRGDGMFRWMLCRALAVRDAAGKPTRIAGSMSDVTKRKVAEERLVHEALHDSLTGLPNRALFLDRLGQALRRSRRRPEHMFAVLFLDLDGFKLVNDSMGHGVGDELLVEISRRIRAAIRPSDTLARLGGDEFAVLMDGIDELSEAGRSADRMHAALGRPVLVNGQEVFTTCSIGIAQSVTGYTRPEELLRDADAAMYRAKEQGRGRHEVFDRALHAAAVARLELETDLHGAIDRGELNLKFQPIVSLDRGETVGFEALCRWTCPKRGEVMPSEFIPIAEDTGLIVRIGEFVLFRACEQMVEWGREDPQIGACRVSVNLSSRQLLEADLAYRVADILATTGFEPANLVLEITESVLMKNAEAVNRTLTELRELGIGIDIDDFGTGYSSLTYLRRFPIDRLKIDRQFIDGLTAGKGDLEIVRAIVTLAQSLGLAVVAEGIETAEQLKRLRLLGCDFGQGYLFSHPVTHHTASLMAFDMAG